MIVQLFAHAAHAGTGVDDSVNCEEYSPPEKGSKVSKENHRWVRGKNSPSTVPNCGKQEARKASRVLSNDPEASAMLWESNSVFGEV